MTKKRKEQDKTKREKKIKAKLMKERITELRPRCKKKKTITKTERKKN